MNHLTENEKTRIRNIGDYLIASLNSGGLVAVAVHERRNLPQCSGIYFLIDHAGTVLYVGQARNLKHRCGAGHHKIPTAIDAGAVSVVIAPVTLDILDNVENYLISYFAPPLNDTGGRWWIVRETDDTSDFSDVSKKQVVIENLRAEIDASMRVEYLTDIISGVLTFVSANPGFTDSETRRKFRCTKSATACFAPGIKLRSERLRICGQKISGLVSALVDRQMLKSDTVPAGTKTKKTLITIGTHLAYSEIVATAQQLIDDGIV